ncbi:MAG: hypothetical protein D6805_01015 [Planctomycetota bacterium]|nr:MAG: hypothetical protein D6805_01015 [Planctomycetota bacterium]
MLGRWVRGPPLLPFGPDDRLYFAPILFFELSNYIKFIFNCKYFFIFFFLLKGEEVVEWEGGNQAFACEREFFG